MRPEADGFASHASALLFAYFAAVLTVTMLVLHPAYLALSAVFAGAYLASMGGLRTLGKTLCWMLPVMLIAVGFNVAFNHRGMTALFYLKNGNAVTMESLVFGLCAAAMLLAAVLWFSCFHRVMTADKLMAFTGRLAPALSLLFSMTLRFVPRITRQLRRTYAAQRALDGAAGLPAAVRRGVRTVSIVVTWALEGAVITADSMRARGYGLPGRTHFHRERWQRRDTLLLLLLVPLTAGTLAGMAAGSAQELFYPALQFAPPTGRNVLAWGCFALLCALPLIIRRKEARAWARSRSAI